MTLYAYVGNVPASLASGRPLASGDRATLTPEEADVPDNKRLIDAGLLVALPDQEETAGQPDASAQKDTADEPPADQSAPSAADAKKERKS